MAKDNRLYGRFTLDFPDNYKVMPLSDAAFRCLVEATLWSRKQMSDGLLARRYAVARWGLDVLTELTTNDPENPSLIEVDEGWMIRDFAEHQDTREEIEARSARNRAAGQKGGQAKAKRGGKRVASTPLSESVAETETKTSTPSAPQGDEDAAAFDRFWAAYPVKKAKAEALKLYRAAIRKSSPQHLLEALEAQKAEYAAGRPLPTDWQYFVQAPRWLRNERWLDDTRAADVPASPDEVLRAAWESGDVSQLQGLAPEQFFVEWPDGLAESERDAERLRQARAWIDANRSVFAARLAA